MSVRSTIFPRVARAFFHPRGLSGSAAGWIMGHRSSNVQRNRWAVDLLDVQPTDRVLEVGFGPGVAVAAAAERITTGRVVGVDPSAVMLRQARRRNAAAIRAGLVELRLAQVEELPDDLGGPFDKLLAVNTVGVWHDPAARLADLAGRMRPGARAALVSQPRCPGATAETTIAAGRELAGYLQAAGFGDLRTETLDLRPPVVCVLGLTCSRWAA
jgi:SAM-dependent methyltransferase